MQIAADGSYQDPKNLQGKLQRHKAFEAELAANKDGIDRINVVRIQIPFPYSFPIVQDCLTVQYFF